MKNCCGDVKTILQKIAMFFIDNTLKKIKDPEAGRAYSRKLRQHQILVKKGIKNFTTPIQSFFWVLHQNKALHKFHKRGQWQLLDALKV